MAASSERYPGIEWSSTPPTFDKAFIPICSPRPGGKVVGIMQGSVLHGVFTHYLDGRTFPCRKVTGVCEGCSRHTGRRWKGYIGILMDKEGKRGIAEVTAQAVRSCPLLVDKSIQLRGGLLTLERSNKSRNAPVKATVRLEPRYMVGYPEWDEEPVLLRIWGAAAEEDDRFEPGQSDLIP